MRLFFVSSLIAASAAATTSRDDLASWLEFKVAFSKSYSSVHDEALRYAIFRENMQFIVAETARNLTYTLGVTPFADLNRSEFQALLFSRPKIVDSRKSTLGLHRWSGDELPSSVDWEVYLCLLTDVSQLMMRCMSCWAYRPQAAGATTPVLDENLNGCFGACWAFAATAAVESAHFIKSKQLIPLTEQQLVECSSAYGNHGCQGGLMDYAYSYLQENPFCQQSTYKYNGVVGSCRSSSCRVGLPSGAVVGHKEVGHTENDLMSAVAQQPVTVAVHGAMGDANAFQFYKGGILTADCGTNVDHGVAVVGYGTDANGNGYWKVKNSYGSGWGVAGYALLQRGKPGGGECGILTGSMSYPVLS